LAKTERYEILQIHRSLIKNAPYNPRKITKEAKKTIKEGLENHGLVAPLTWNKRTGNLVSGHQRIAQIDVIENTKDYTLQVAVIDVDIKQEKEINILLNNQKAQGEFDLDKLADVLEDIDYKSAGFNADELEDLLGGIDIDALSDEDIEERRASYEEGIAHRRRMQKASFRENNIEFYTNVVFPDKNKRSEFFAMLGIKDDLIIDGVKVMAQIRSRYKRNYSDDE
jgi:ParB-like chromosome segregation protein Spo0J